MINSLENRSLFLDKELVNFIFSVPPEFLVQKGILNFC